MKRDASEVLLIQGLEFPADCPDGCKYKGTFAKYGQSSICGRCPVFCCQEVLEDDGSSWCLVEPDDYRGDWLKEWYEFFKSGKEPRLPLSRQSKDPITP